MKIFKTSTLKITNIERNLQNYAMLMDWKTQYFKDVNYSKINLYPTREYCERFIIYVGMQRPKKSQDKLEKQT